MQGRGQPQATPALPACGMQGCASFSACSSNEFDRRPFLAHRQTASVTPLDHTTDRRKYTEYVEQILATLSQELTQEYWRGFAEENLYAPIPFAEPFPDEQNVVLQIRQLWWIHSVVLIPLAMESARRLLEHREVKEVGDVEVVGGQ